MNEPELRFPEFKEEWEPNTINELFDNITDYVAAGSFASIRENVKYLRDPAFAQLIRTVDLKNHFCNNDFIYVDQKGFKYLWRVNLNENSIVLPNIGANIGEVYFTDPDNLPYENNVLAPNSILLKSNKNLMFKYHLLCSPKFLKELKIISESSGQPKFNKTNLKKIKLNIPSIYEQDKIASFLSKVDEKIEKLKKKQQLWETYKKGIIQQIFSQKLRFKDENGEYYPDWEEKFIDNIFDIGRGEVIAKTKLKIIPDTNYCYPVYSSQTQNKGIMGYHNTFDFDGDFITWTTDGANAGKVMYRNGKFKCSNVCGVLKAKNEFIGMANTCIAEILDSVTYKYVSYVGNPKLMNNVMAKIKISIPSISEQKKIANFISLIDNKIDFILKELELNKEYKKGLLKQMFC